MTSLSDTVWVCFTHISVPLLFAPHGWFKTGLQTRRSASPLSEPAANRDWEVWGDQTSGVHPHRCFQLPRLISFQGCVGGTTKLYLIALNLQNQAPSFSKNKSYTTAGLCSIVWTRSLCPPNINFYFVCVLCAFLFFFVLVLRNEMRLRFNQPKEQKISMCLDRCGQKLWRYTANKKWSYSGFILKLLVEDDRETWALKFVLQHQLAPVFLKRGHVSKCTWCVFMNKVCIW